MRGTAWSIALAGVSRGLCAGLLIAMIELALHALWHPGRAPLELDARGWLRGAALAAAWYAGIAAAFGLVWALVFLRAYRRRGPHGPRDAARAALLLPLWLGLGAEALWFSRFILLSGESAFGAGRLFQALVLLAAALPAAALASALVLRARRFAPSLALVVIAAALIASVALPPRIAALAPAEPDRPSLVLIVVDALRADRLGCYAERETPGQPATLWEGRAHAATPNLDALAGRGTLYERFFVQAPYTWASIASLFTGELPSRHRLLRMSARERLALSHGTLAEQLDAAGWSTAAFLSGTLTNGSGLVRGFAGLLEENAGRGFHDRRDPWALLRAELVPLRAVAKLRARLDREWVTSEAVRWIDAQGERPFFLYVHLFSTHTPYAPPAAHRPAAPGAAPLERFDGAMARRIEEGEWTPGAAEWAAIRALYDGGASWADHQVGRLLEALERSGRLASTVVAVTADHGEELGDHAIQGRPCIEHDWMWNTNLRVPLLIAGPGWGRGERIARVHSALELAPTMRRLLTGELSRNGDLMHGGSGIAIAENAGYRAAQDARYKLLVERFAPRREQLHDLWRDPWERAPLTRALEAHEHRAFERLRAALAPLAAEDRRAFPAAEMEDRGSRDALRAFGYLTGPRQRGMIPSDG